MIYKGLLILFIFLFNLTGTAFAGEVVLSAAYPYSLDTKSQGETYGTGTQPLYINIENYNDSQPQKVRLEVLLPAGIKVDENSAWRSQENEAGLVLFKELELSANYGQNFDLLYLRSEAGLAEGKNIIKVKLLGDGWEKEKVISFNHNALIPEGMSVSKEGKTSSDISKFNWYIQSLTLPVDNLGHKDERAQDGTIYIRDTALESFRNRMTGGGTTNWAAVFNHPATHVFLEMRNPQLDKRVLKFKAELVDKISGETVPGLCMTKVSDNEAEQGWSGATEGQDASTALISLDGIKNQSFILPIYADQFKIIAGEYNLRVTVEGSGQKKVYETPIKVAKQRSMGIFAVGFSFLCLLILIVNFGKLKRCILRIGAKGAITVSLFAAVAFGGVVLPSTLLGDFLHVILGPFSGLATGIFNGVLLYLLVMSLLVLYRKPGVVALMFFLKWMLAGLMFGKFTPIGVLSYTVYIVVLESVLWLCGFYRINSLSKRYIIFVSIMIGLADAFITMINLEQMMFFYRLYYADWYIFLYMFVNGLLYSSLGCIMGYKVGCKLQQVMGE